MNLLANWDRGTSVIDDLKSRAFGEVWVAKETLSGVLVAIKKVKEIEQGVESLKNCISPFIVRYFNVLQKGGEVWVDNECVVSRLDCDGVLPLRFCSQNYPER